MNHSEINTFTFITGQGPLGVCLTLTGIVAALLLCVLTIRRKAPAPLWHYLILLLIHLPLIVLGWKHAVFNYSLRDQTPVQAAIARNLAELVVVARFAALEIGILGAISAGSSGAAGKRGLHITLLVTGLIVAMATIAAWTEILEFLYSVITR
jgi:hypothetical protein